MYQRLISIFNGLDHRIILLLITLLIIVFRPSLHDHGPWLVEDSTLERRDTDKKYGIDVSHYQGSIDWEKAKKEISFAFVKATEGTGYVDTRYQENSVGLKEQKIISGAYHFYQPKLNPIEQADHFVKTIQAAGHELRPVLDIEISDEVSAKLIQKDALQWLQRVEEKIDCKPIIYTYASFWDEYLGKSFNDYKFWLAAYTSAENPQPPKTRQDWQLWQFSDKGHISGIDGFVDRDVFDLSKNDFEQLKC